MISYNNVNVWFNAGTPMENHALKDLSVEIKEGDFVTVIGSNGAGKSTMLNALAGTIPVQDGKIEIDGVNVINWSAARRSSLIAQVFQDPMAGTCADLSVEENMAVAYRRGQRRSLSLGLNKNIRNEFRDYLSVLGMGLENRLKDPIGLLSGGQRQTISLLMAVLSPMKILVLDEHTAALDPKMADLVLNLTKRIVEERNLTVLMITHSMHQALNIGNRTVMMHHGRVMFDIKGEERSELSVPKLLEKFKKATGSEIDEDKLALD